MTSRADAAARARRGMPALAPLAALYGIGLVVARRRGLSRRGTKHTSARVVSIGNLEVGGSGKTPLAIHLLEQAVAAGIRVAYVSRGYVGRAARAPYVSVCVPAWARYPGGGGIHLLGDEDAGLLGDEAALVRRRVPEAMVAVARDKRRAVRVADGAGTSLVIVDDAFQTWSLVRDVDVVLLDAERPLASGRLLPAGTLREDPSALRRADAVVFNGAQDDDAVESARAAIATHLAPGTQVFGMRRSVRLVGAGGADAGGARQVYVASAIARPERFLADVVQLGLTVTGARVFPDHHRYCARDVRALQESLRATGADALVVTEKDWVKLQRFPWEMRVCVAHLEVGLFGAAPEFITGTK